MNRGGGGGLINQIKMRVFQLITLTDTQHIFHIAEKGAY